MFTTILHFWMILFLPSAEEAEERETEERRVFLEEEAAEKRAQGKLFVW